MSNFVGRWLKSAMAEHSHLNRFDSNKTYTIGRLQIYAEGLPETHFLHKGEKGGPHWCIAGMGIDIADSKASIVDGTAWHQYLSQEPPQFPKDGHFAVVRWDSMRLTLTCDALEVRRIYWFETPDEFCFSTRLDWLLRLKHRAQFHEPALASQFHMINSFTEECFIHGIHRIGAGGRLTVTNTPASLKKNHFTPDKTIVEDIPKLLSSLSKLPVESEKKISLGLSGGMNSRGLLAMMLEQTPTQLSLHSFGESGDADFDLAQKAAEQFSLPINLHHLEDANTNGDTMHLLRETALQTEMGMSLQLYRLPSFLEKMHRENHWMIDGAFGEYLRRAYGHSILKGYKKEMLSGNFKKLAEGFFTTPPQFLSERIRRDYRPFAIEQFAEACHQMPFINKNSPEFWLDLLLLRNRVPNFPPNGQGWIESAIPAIMPYAQPTIIHSLMNIPLSQKSESRIVKQIINKTTPSVKKLPLAKHGTTLPFMFAGHTAPSKAFAILKNKLAKNTFQPTAGAVILEQIQEELQDRIHSEEVQKFHLYSKQFLKESAKQLENPKDIKADAAEEILKWLAFDFWREEVEGVTS